MLLFRQVKKMNENENMESPGQLLKHYSPYLPCYFCSDLSELNSKETPFKAKDIDLMAFD